METQTRQPADRLHPEDQWPWQEPFFSRAVAAAVGAKLLLLLSMIAFLFDGPLG